MTEFVNAQTAKVIKGLECCKAIHIYLCSSCPYHDDDVDDNNCQESLCADALELLKEQETEWEHLWDAPDGTYKGRCKKCGFVHFFIENHDGQYRFCPSCGKAVK